MKKTALFFLLCPMSIGTCLANSQEWTSRYEMGLSEYKIQTYDHQKIKISCNTTAGSNFDHYVTFSDGKHNYQNTDSKFPLSFKFDNALHITPLGTTNWRQGATAWNTFKNHIATARKIEVFINGMKAADFTPDTTSILNIAQEIKGCEALGS